MPTDDLTMPASFRAALDAALARLEVIDGPAAETARGVLGKTAQEPRALSVLLNRIHGGIAAREAARAALEGAANPDNTNA
jgi:hypothetical protein